MCASSISHVRQCHAQCMQQHADSCMHIIACLLNKLNGVFTNEMPVHRDMLRADRGADPGVTCRQEAGTGHVQLARQAHLSELPNREQGGDVVLRQSEVSAGLRYRTSSCVLFFLSLHPAARRAMTLMLCLVCWLGFGS